MSDGPSPQLAAGARIQRQTNEFPILHLEPLIPWASSWEVVVDGLVDNPTVWPLDQIQEMVEEKRVWDLNCVWGWTRPACEWEGVPAARLIDAARPMPEAAWVLASAMGGQYSSCLTTKRARRSLLAWRLDGAALTPEHGWPLRFVPPPTKWAYKGVKWVSRLTLMADFQPGFWEELVGDVHGDIPPGILGHLEDRTWEDGNG